MSHAKRVTTDNKKNSEYRVIAAIRKLRTDTNCPAGKSWPNRLSTFCLGGLVLSASVRRNIFQLVDPVQNQHVFSKGLQGEFFQLQPFQVEIYLF